MLCFQSETMIGDDVGEWLSFPKLNICFITSNINYNCTWKHIIQVGNLPHGCEFGGLVQNNLQT
jgi:hypothetical protein